MGFNSGFKGLREALPSKKRVATYQTIQLNVLEDRYL